MLNIYFFLEHKQTKWFGCVFDKIGFGSIQSPCSTCQSVFSHVYMKQQLLNVPDWLFFMSTVTGAGGLAAQSPTDKKQCFQSEDGRGRWIEGLMIIWHLSGVKPSPLTTQPLDKMD